MRTDTRPRLAKSPILNMVRLTVRPDTVSGSSPLLRCLPPASPPPPSAGVGPSARSSAWSVGGVVVGGLVGRRCVVGGVVAAPPGRPGGRWRRLGRWVAPFGRAGCSVSAAGRRRGRDLVGGAGRDAPREVAGRRVLDLVAGRLSGREDQRRGQTGRGQTQEDHRQQYGQLLAGSLGARGGVGANGRSAATAPPGSARPGSAARSARCRSATASPSARWPRAPRRRTRRRWRTGRPAAWPSPG